MCFSPHTTSFPVHWSTQWESITYQTCTAVTLLKSSIRSHPTHICCQSLFVFTSTWGPIESGYWREMDVDSSSWTCFSAQAMFDYWTSRSFESDLTLNKMGSRNDLNASFTNRIEPVLESAIHWTENRLRHRHYNVTIAEIIQLNSTGNMFITLLYEFYQHT